MTADTRIVAIDGPSGSGKSTVARAVAERLGLDVLDTGAMYRALTLLALEGGVDPTDGAACRRLAGEMNLELGTRTRLNGRDVSATIRGPEVTAAVSTVSAHPGVREVLVGRQRAWVSERRGGVVEGRDIGTVVFPDARVKVFLTASEAEVLALGGVGEGESLAAPIFKTTRLRFSWLFVNLLTAIMASIVIGLFEASLSKIVALAVLMPIVASMGGNAGTQTLTVVVRALATKELTSANVRRVFNREVLIGLMNGIAFAVIAAAITWGWFRDWHLAGVIALAMIINLLAAALAGILVPLSLNRTGVDPAVSSTVFVTTVTDVVGFFSFLGLATWVMMR